MGWGLQTENFRLRTVNSFYNGTAAPWPRPMEIFFTTAMTVAGMGYLGCGVADCGRAGVFSTSAARLEAPPFFCARRSTILKSLKGVDPGMMDAFRSHCRQSYLKAHLRTALRRLRA